MQPPAMRLLSRSQMIATGLTMRFAKAAVASDSKGRIFIAIDYLMRSIGDVRSDVVVDSVYLPKGVGVLMTLGGTGTSESCRWPRSYAVSVKLTDKRSASATRCVLAVVFEC